MTTTGPEEKAIVEGPSRVKHVPERSCVACGARRPKEQLVRVVRSPGGAIEIDPEGRKPGRGAYLCRAANCWEAGLKKNRLEHVLKTQVTPGDRESLLKYGKSLVSPETDMPKQS